MISIICPVYNEEYYIENILKHFISTKPDEKEIIFVDGGSTDKTVLIISEYAKQNNGIRLLYNDKKFVPFALNIAIQEAKGDPIIRMDAHSEYADDYFEAILRVFNETGADIVGGGYNLRYKSIFQQNVGLALASVYGTGGSEAFDVNIKGYCDQIVYGAWRKSIFKKIGYFDEELLRNQDDEFHYRAKRAGLKLFRDPSIVLWYYPRDTLKGLFKQYFEYGDYRPLSLSKVSTGMKLRHIAPALLAVYLISLPLLLTITHQDWMLFPAVIYVVLVGCISIATFKKIFSSPGSLLIFYTLHLAYGAGFLKGIGKLIYSKISNE